MTHRITTPNEGETALAEYEAGGIAFTQLPADPVALRISLGEVPAGPSYCVYRGPRHAILALLKRTVAALELEA